MDTSVGQVEELEKQLKRIVNLAFCMQGLWVVAFVCLFFLLHDFYQKNRQILSIIALFSSFAISRFCIGKGKELDEIKRFSKEEIEAKKREYLISFGFLWLSSFLSMFDISLGKKNFKNENSA